MPSMWVTEYRRPGGTRWVPCQESPPPALYREIAVTRCELEQRTHPSLAFRVREYRRVGR